MAKIIFLLQNIFRDAEDENKSPANVRLRHVGHLGYLNDTASLSLFFFLYLDFDFGGNIAENFYRGAKVSEGLDGFRRCGSGACRF